MEPVNLRAAARRLSELSSVGMGRVPLMKQVDALLQQFRRANAHENVYIAEKISDVRIYFDELGKGGRGKFTVADATRNVHSAIAKLERLISDDGFRLLH